MIRHEHRLVLPIPCPTADLRAELDRLGDGAQLVDIALAADDGHPVTVGRLADAVLVVTAGPAEADPEAGPVQPSTAEYRPSTELGRLVLAAEQAIAEGTVTNRDQLREQLGIGTDAALVFWRYLGRPA